MTFSGRESLALRACSLWAIPPPPPEVRPMEGLSGVNLQDASLVQWSSYVQDVAAGMRQPPKVAMDCPEEDTKGILYRLELETRVPFCRSCFGIGGYCSCTTSASSLQTPLWSPPAYSYASMAAAMATTASTSGTGASTSALPPPGFPALPHPSPIAGAGRGQEKILEDKLARARAAAIRQMCPRALPPQQMTTEVVQATPYEQQVFLPPPNPPQQGREVKTQPTTTRAGTTSVAPSSSALTETSARGRARERESREAPRHRSSTRGSLKRMRTFSSERSIGDLDRYKPSGWRRDLVFIVGCYYAAQVGSVAEGSQPWESDCQKFLDAMEQCRSTQWLDIKELHPLDYMGYVASVFMETTGHYLSGLSNYTGWIRPKSYYHWKVAELGQMDLHTGQRPEAA